MICPAAVGTDGLLSRANMLSKILSAVPTPNFAGPAPSLYAQGGSFYRLAGKACWRKSAFAMTPGKRD